MSSSAVVPPTLHIGDVAERVGLSLRTVRYYEEQGLFAPAGRTDGGFRLYTDEQVDRLLLIKQMKPLGFTVQQMRELLDARDALEAGDEGTRAAAPGTAGSLCGGRGEAVRGAAHRARARRGVRRPSRAARLTGGVPAGTPGCDRMSDSGVSQTSSVLPGAVPTTRKASQLRGFRVGDTGLEPVTSCLVEQALSQLS